MVHSVRMVVAAGDDVWWRVPAGLRSFAYELLGLGCEGVAKATHDGTGTRAFSVAVLREDVCRAIRPFTSGPGLEALGSPGGSERWVHIRLTALNAETYNAMIAGLLAAALGSPVPVGRQRLAIRDAVADEPPWAASGSYESLAGVSFHPTVRLLFLTPTAFSQGGDRHLPLPVPDLMLKSWHRRWNQFAPEHLRIPDEQVEAILPRLALSGVSIRSRSVSLDRLGAGKEQARVAARVVGFTGEATLHALRPQEWPREARSAFAALTAYSGFCGTGARTTQGFGLTIPFFQDTEPWSTPNMQG